MIGNEPPALSLRLKGLEPIMRRYPVKLLPTLASILAMLFAGGSLAQTQTVLWPKSAPYIFSIAVPPD
jgi:hypothetical protein